MSQPDVETVLHEVKDGVATITLNKPEMANAMSGDQRNLIIELLTGYTSDPAVRVVVIGASGRHFCAGADLRGMGGAAGRPVGTTLNTMLAGAQRLVAAVLDCGKPVIAAVQGPASGLGSHLAMACDFIVAQEGAFFQEPFLLRGLTVDAAGAYLLPRRMGLQKAKELIMLGDRLPVEEALAMGLVNKVVPAAEFQAAVDHLAGRLANSATVGIMLAKKLLNASLDTDRAAAFLAEALAQEVNSRTLDSKEGVVSFLEKRPSNFQGN